MLNMCYHSVSLLEKKYVFCTKKIVPNIVITPSNLIYVLQENFGKNSTFRLPGNDLMCSAETFLEMLSAFLIFKLPGQNFMCSAK